VADVTSAPYAAGAMKHMRQHHQNGTSPFTMRNTPASLRDAAKMPQHEERPAPRQKTRR